MALTGGDNSSCQLLGPTSIVIQLAMGMAVLAGLLAKRNHEHPRRKLVVWGYDVGKQMIGALGIHFVNLALGLWQQRRALFAQQESGDDDAQCDWYFLNLLSDTTVGLPILWVTLIVLQSVLQHFHVENIESGNYFPSTTAQSPGKQKPLFSAFLKQLLVFSGGLIIMKFAVYELLKHYEDGAFWFADLLLGWCDRWPNFQVFLIMFVCPVALNFFQYFCVDNIIKLPTDCVNSNNIENFEPETLQFTPAYEQRVRHAIYGSSI